uniref:Lysozyme g n=1 Tax=Scleropages formosus TaxID=113540 RepID=A0A8C9R5W8_SCLFO
SGFDRVLLSGGNEDCAILLFFPGVQASYELAECDLDYIVTVAGYDSMDPAVISGIISRKFLAEAMLRNGWGDHGDAFGLTQGSDRVHYRHHSGTWDNEENVKQGTEILIDFINESEKKFPRWTSLKAHPRNTHTHFLKPLVSLAGA